MTRSSHWLLRSLIIALLFFGMARAVGAEITAGTIKSLDLYMRTMVLIDDDGAEWTMSLPGDVIVRPYDCESRVLTNLFSAAPAVNIGPDPIETQLLGNKVVPRVEYRLKVSDLRPGDRVVVTFEEDEDERTVSEIRLKLR